MNLVIYSVTAQNPCAEAVDIVNRVNSLIASQGDSLSRERTQATLDEQVSADVQAAYGLKVIGTGFEMEHDE